MEDKRFLNQIQRWRVYWLYWLKSAGLTFQSLMATRFASVVFVVGKFFRFFFFLWFLLLLKERIQTVVGYSVEQLVVFYLVFNLFDMLGQIFYRGIYWFRNEIVSGNFDFKLIKPLSPLFQIMTSHTDFLDVPLFILVIVFLAYSMRSISFIEIAGFVLLTVVALVLITAIHIMVAAIGVITTEVDHTIWIFRDLSMMGRVPVDIYTDLVRGFLTFVVPVALIFTVPAKVLFGLVNFQALLVTVVIAGIFYWLALRLWRYALTQYSSASS